MEGNKRVYSKPDLTVMHYTPSDAVMACYKVTCLIGNQEETYSESDMTFYYGSVNGVSYVVWYYNYGDNKPGNDSYNSIIKSVLEQNNVSVNQESYMGAHVAYFDSSAAQSDASSY